MKTIRISKRWYVQVSWPWKQFWIGFSHEWDHWFFSVAFATFVFCPACGEDDG